MGTESESKFYVSYNPLIKKEDLPNLPRELREDFDMFIDLLSQNPYAPEEILDEDLGIGSHCLDRELSGWRAMEIDYLGEAYRLIYRINDDPRTMRVEIVSFDRHDPAYDKAKRRTERERRKDDRYFVR